MVSHRRSALGGYYTDGEIVFIVLLVILMILVLFAGIAFIGGLALFAVYNWAAAPALGWPSISMPASVGAAGGGLILLRLLRWSLRA